MKIKTEICIAEKACDYATGYTEDSKEVANDSFSDGAKWIQSNLVESASEGMIKAIEALKNVNFNGDFERYRTYWLEEVELWQACSLHHAKLLKEKDKRIKELETKYQEEVKDIEHFINLIETFFDDDEREMEVNFYKSKYGLDKQERES